MTEHFENFYLTDDKTIILDKHTEVYALLQNAYWTKGRSASTMRDAIANSLNYAIFETSTDRLIGFARVITDYATVFYLCDVFIDAEFRGLGLGKKLIEHILLHEDKLIGISGLLKTGDAKPLYEKYGFEECKSICMVRNSIGGTPNDI